MLYFQVILFLCGLSYGNFTAWNSNGTVQCYECESVDDKADDMNQGCWILEQEGEPLGDGRGTCLGLRQIEDALDTSWNWGLELKSLKFLILILLVSSKDTVALYPE